MRKIRLAAPAYFAIVFGIGFLLGAVRELVVQPRLGPVSAVMLEAPAMLLASWLAARWVVRRFAVIGTSSRLRLGFVAFALLMAAELAGSMGLRGMTPGQWLAHFTQPPGLLSLSLFAAFAAMPLIVRR
jgi:hypothetical protein